MTAGISYTLMALETTLDNGPWIAAGFPTVRGIPDVDPLLGPGAPFGGCHAGGLNALFVDGTVRFKSNSIDPALCRTERPHRNESEDTARRSAAGGSLFLAVQFRLFRLLLLQLFLLVAGQMFRGEVAQEERAGIHAKQTGDELLLPLLLGEKLIGGPELFRRRQSILGVLDLLRGRLFHDVVYDRARG